MNHWREPLGDCLQGERYPQFGWFRLKDDALVTKQFYRCLRLDNVGIPSTTQGFP
jgi:hypothetical protein